jgi:hypothetical protein
MSHVKAIDQLYSRQVNAGRPFKAEQIVRVSYGSGRFSRRQSLFVARLPGNKWWTNYDGVFNVAMMNGRPEGQHDAVLRGLVKLGFITKAEYEEHAKRGKEISEYQSAVSDLAVVLRTVNKYPELKLSGVTEFKKRYGIK